MNTKRVSIDAQSGDFGAEVIIRGVIEAKILTHHPFIAHLCGDGPEIERVLTGLKEELEYDSSEFVIHHCKDTISSFEKRSRVWRTHTDSSIVKCITLQKENLVDASVSAGDTAILTSAALFMLGRKNDLKRPALAAVVPTTGKKPVLLLDVGANLNCRTEHLVSFACMGDEYMRSVFNVSSPRVALLNIGKEPSKGPVVIQEAAKALDEQCRLLFQGYIEGNRVFSGDADVVVCDGFAGNVLLKTCESFFALTASVLENDPSFLNCLIKKMEILNPENYGAVPFLGVKGIVLKAHGGSSSHAFRNAVHTALRTLESKNDH